MTIQELGSLGELVAAIATVATLGYLALQIRQSSESQRLSSELEMSKMVVDWHAQVTADPELSRIWDTAVDPGAMSEEDVRRFLWLLSTWFMIHDGQYEFYVKGHLSEKSWQSKVETIVGVLKNPIVAEWWENRHAPLTREFREYVDSIRDSVDPDWQHRMAGKLSRTSE